MSDRVPSGTPPTPALNVADYAIAEALLWTPGLGDVLPPVIRDAVDRVRTSLESRGLLRSPGEDRLVVTASEASPSAAVRAATEHSCDGRKVIAVEIAVSTGEPADWVKEVRAGDLRDAIADRIERDWEVTSETVQPHDDAPYQSIYIAASPLEVAGSVLDLMAELGWRSPDPVRPPEPEADESLTVDAQAGADGSEVAPGGSNATGAHSARKRYPLLAPFAAGSSGGDELLIAKRREAAGALDEIDAGAEAIRALVERVQRGGPSNVLDHLGSYMSPEAASLVRDALAAGGEP